MRYLLIFGIVLILAWRWRVSRNAKIVQSKPKPQNLAEPIRVVQCSRCGVHLQSSDLFPGTKGNYCSLEHRALSEP
jgi:uncharacterized protein